MATKRITYDELLRMVGNARRKLDSGSLQRDTLRKYGPVILEDIKSNFAEESSFGKSPTGNVWAPLAASTVKKKITKTRRRGGGNILHPRGSRGFMGTLQWAVHGNKLFVGTNKTSKRGFPYPAVHQTGTSDLRVPKRTWGAISDTIIKRIQREIAGGLFG